jgi:hypothetical protein
LYTDDSNTTYAQIREIFGITSHGKLPLLANAPRIVPKRGWPFILVLAVMVKPLEK